MESPNPESIIEAARLLRAGKVVAFATETVYGLGADATNGHAVADIFALKGRPRFNPLIVHVSDVAMARGIVRWNARAETLAAAFWPGPLTLVLERAAPCAVSLLASAGGSTLGIRMPAHPLALALIRAANVPLAAPSANLSGRVSPTTARHVAEDFGDTLPLIMDGGACEVGIESTVLDISAPSPMLLRPGGITRAQLETVLGEPVQTQESVIGALKSPGLLHSHYAPRLPMRLRVAQPMQTEALLAFGPDVPPGSGVTFNLSASGDLKEAAARLFAGLHLLDNPRFSAIAVMPIPEEGIGAAINDRLQRAAVR